MQALAPQVKAPLLGPVAEHGLDAWAHESRLATDFIDVGNTRQAFDQGPIAHLGLAARRLGRLFPCQIPDKACIRASCARTQGDDRQLDREFVTVAVQRAQPQSLSEQVRLPVVRAPQPALMQQTLLLGDDHLGESLAHHLVDRPTEGLLSAAIPGGDVAEAVHQDDRVEGSIEQLGNHAGWPEGRCLGCLGAHG